ncbi:hypothetical protein H310_14265 [Aphanomyces invadans]|uniref:Uncharacterized protein n=1 Tax=Aphanomyces invadans TaxID=157072 RepID=A0A024TA52_9STRA|nr:hypothetical protein H310_14265 [Aphanomyces invadans]ETV91025.1 hypothetical protein H310_14265 [Aphanomyces invadans]|eukprot:XP_008880305.1 hypothetical protein H310_14265 [Aphanomyces invadans]
MPKYVFQAWVEAHIRSMDVVVVDLGVGPVDGDVALGATLQSSVTGPVPPSAPRVADLARSAVVPDRNHGMLVLTELLASILTNTSGALSTVTITN